MKKDQGQKRGGGGRGVKRKRGGVVGLASCSESLGGCGEAEKRSDVTNIREQLKIEVWTKRQTINSIPIYICGLGSGKPTVSTEEGEEGGGWH